MLGNHNDDDDDDDDDDDADDDEDLLQHGLANITSDNPGAVWGQQSGELTASAPFSSAW